MRHAAINGSNGIGDILKRAMGHSPNSETDQS